MSSKSEKFNLKNILKTDLTANDSSWILMLEVKKLIDKRPFK